MPKLTPYRDNYLKNTWNFSLPLNHSETGVNDVLFVLNPGDMDIEIDMRSIEFRKTANIGTDVTMQVNVLELAVPVTGGVDTTNYLKANVDRNETDDIGLTTLIDDDVTPLVIDETGARNILRSGGIASKGVVSYTPNIDFKYRLKKNTDYLIKSTIINGATDESESVLSGRIKNFE